MDTAALMVIGTAINIVLVIVAVIVIGLLAALLVRGLRTRNLKLRFGPEYDRTVAETGSRLRAEVKLERLQKRVERLHIEPLQRSDRMRFVESWHAIQARFVDKPSTALAQADRLVQDVMTARGYPVGDVEQRAADISVDHPLVVEHYRSGHAIAARHAEAQTSTEEMRQAMIHYRLLFDELISPDAGSMRRAG